VEPYIFKTADHTGKVIILTEKTFNAHILPGHPEMSGNENAIQETIENPEYVILSSVDDKSHIYVAKSSNSSYPNIYIKTIVTSSGKTGYVKTSFFQRNVILDKEGKVIFP